MNIDAIISSFCCIDWKKARSEGTDSEGDGSLIWDRKDDPDIGDDKPNMGNIGIDTKLKPIRFCPWCKHDWGNGEMGGEYQHNLKCSNCGIIGEVICKPDKGRGCQITCVVCGHKQRIDLTVINLDGIDTELFVF